MFSFLSKVFLNGLVILALCQGASYGNTGFAGAAAGAKIYARYAPAEVGPHKPLNQ